MASKMPQNVGVNELSRFSDSPGDASLDDLFQPGDKSMDDRAGEASSSISASHVNQVNGYPADAVKNDLATKLRATIAKKQMENELVQSNGGGNLLRLMMDARKDDVIDIDGLVFDEKLPAEHLFPLQIPVVMSFAVPNQPREVRMEAAYFFQQLCHSSSLTLQMFIACRGIPVLVGFLEADYAKYREMVHLAIDGMWHVFKLQRSTPKNEFCRIAAKNGILLRLINTLYSLNEATRLACVRQHWLFSRWYVSKALLWSVGPKSSRIGPN